MLHYGDITDPISILHILHTCKPDEIYNLAGQSHVSRSFQMPAQTFAVNAQGVINLLECIRAAGLTKSTRVYQACSSEMFGDNGGKPLDEGSPLNPLSPYATAKAAAHSSVAQYRKAYGMYVVSGIAFNHESPRRGMLWSDAQHCSVQVS